MPVRVQNTLSRSLEALAPLKPGRVSMYVCGPTVYDDPHLGHLRSAFAFEIVRRVLKREYGEYDPKSDTGVKFVRNVTDIDDKIIQRAAERGTDWAAIARTYHEAYLKDTARLGVQAPTHEPKATENLEGMFAIIQRLIERGAAYASEGSVYFSVRKFGAYGELSHQKADEMLDNWRGETGDGKRDALDFALWKRTKAGEPFWESPWGPGRPGWHIECSAMSARFCGEEFDIHGGGKDLLFPHHENERAQSMACFGGGFAKYWIHHGLVTIEGRKMSKSLGNFLTLDAFLEKYPADVLKLFFLQSHYSQDVDFTWEKMKALQEALRSMTDLIEKTSAEVSEGLPMVRPESFMEPLANDFNTPQALAVLFAVLREGNAKLAAGDAAGARAAAEELLQKGRFLGLFAEAKKAACPEIEEIVRLRAAARAKKLFAVSDRIRDGLAGMGLRVEDSKDGSRVLGLKQDFDPAAHAPELRKLIAEVAGQIA
jgi:cysteinyl-tRNA synthetase